MANIVVEQHDHWVEIILNRPERRNAITGPLLLELNQNLQDFGNDDDIHLIMLRGADDGFCSGLDIKEFNLEPQPAWLTDYPDLWRQTHKLIYDSHVPVLGVLQRYAINAGAALALACDLLVCGDESFLQVGETQQGIGVAYNVAWLKLRHGEAAANRFAYTADRVMGNELAALGIACRCTPESEVLNVAYEMADRIASFPADALAMVKRTIKATRLEDADSWFDRTTNANVLGIPKPRMVKS